MHEKVALKRQRSGELTVDRRASNTTGSGLVNNTCARRAVVTEYLDRNVLNTAELTASDEPARDAATARSRTTGKKIDQCDKLAVDRHRYSVRSVHTFVERAKLLTHCGERHAVACVAWVKT